MPNIKILDILIINCNTIGTQEADQSTKCNTNTDNGQGSVVEQLYTDPRQEADRPEKCYTDKGSSNSKCINIDKPVGNNNKINHFHPGPNQENDKKVSTEITQQLQRDFKNVFNGIGCFDETFLLQVKPDSKPYQVPKMCSLCPVNAF